MCICMLRSCLESQGCLFDGDSDLAVAQPVNLDVAETRPLLRWIYAAISVAYERGKPCSPSSARMKGMRLKGSPFPAPCLGGPPTLKNPLTLVPTFQTVRSRSARETVRRRRPSGLKQTSEMGDLCGSMT